MAGGALPAEFWTPNEYNVRGGIEGAFLSTTLDRTVAFDYASRPGKPGLVFEMQMGMIDRGADFKWLSQVAPPAVRPPRSRHEAATKPPRDWPCDRHETATKPSRNQPRNHHETIHSITADREAFLKFYGVGFFQ